MMKRLLIVVGVLMIFLTGCGGGGGGSNVIDLYVGTWQGLVPDLGFEWRVTLTDGGLNAGNNPQYGFEVWDLEPGAEYMWGAGYAEAYATGLIDFYVYDALSQPIFHFSGYISGDTWTGEIFDFPSNTYAFVFTRQ